MRHSDWILFVLIALTSALLVAQYCLISLGASVISVNHDAAGAMMNKFMTAALHAEQSSADFVRQARQQATGFNNDFSQLASTTLASLLATAQAGSWGGSIIGMDDTDLHSTGKQRSDNDKNNPDYYVVFSTSCSEQQHWESLVFFYHAYAVKQPGRTITRIASGCNEKQAEELKEFHRDYIQNGMSDRFRLHLTPDYSTRRLERGKYPYKYMNKPYGLRHWMEESLGMKPNANGTGPSRDVLDGIVMLMDPDMVLLRPLVHNFTDEHVLWVQPPNNNKSNDNGFSSGTTVVRHGHPIAQQDGYLGNDWMKLNVSYITNLPEGQYKLPPVNRISDGPLHWNTGPPYLATVQDMYRIAVLWTEYAPRVLDIFPELFAEMYGFIHATVQLDLPFTLIKSLAVSTTTTRQREGWAYIDALGDNQVCSPRLNNKNTTLPVALHYCKRYYNEKWFFSKYRIKKNIMNCEKPLLRPPPADLVRKNYNYAILPPRADLSDKKTYNEPRVLLANRRVRKREAFMLCGLTRAVNQALRFHKKQKCNNNSNTTANLNETYTVHEDPTNY